MAFDINSDLCNQSDKHAMLISGNGSDSSISVNNTPLLDSSSSSVGSSSSNIFFIRGLQASRRLSSVDISSLPRVHSVRRPIDGLNQRDSQPDLINSSQQFGLNFNPQDLSPTSNKKHSLSFEKCHNASQATSLKSQTIDRIDTPSKSLKDLQIETRLNAPGKSLVVKNEDLHYTALLEPLPVVVAADKLRPYSPSLITVVKEGPSLQVCPPLLSTNSEEELTLLQDLSKQVEAEHMVPEHSSTDSSFDEEINMIQDCKCRMVLEEHLLESLSKCFKLQNQMEESDTKCARWQEEVGSLRTRVQELELELGTRTASLQGLKVKFAEQYVEYSDVTDHKRRAERDVKALQSEMDSLKKSESWYREQLHACQAERLTQKKELMAAKQEVESQRWQSDRQAAELRRLQEQVHDIAARARREKQMVTRQLDMALAKQGPDALPSTASISEESHTVTELRQVVSDLEVSLKSSTEQLRGATNEGERLLRRSLQLQQELCDTKVQLQLQRDVRESAEVDRDMARANLKEREEALSQLCSENSSLSVQLESALREHAGVAETMTTLNCNFTTVSNNWRTMKAETKSLTEELETARAALRALQGERDALVERVDGAERREQAVRRQLAEQESAAARASRLEHEVLALKESLDRARTDAACLEAAQRSAVVLERTVGDLERRNEQLRGQVDGLAQLLQENTGSRIEDHVQLQQRARVDQLQAENSLLQQTVQRSASRLGELSKTMESLEAEMDIVRQQQGEPEALREEVARLATENEEAVGRLSAQASELQQLREERSTLLRAKVDLTERVAQLASWLQAVTDGTELGRQFEAKQRMERLSITPVVFESAGAEERDPLDRCENDGDPLREGDALKDQLEALRDANMELALYADALQRRLDADLDPQLAPPDVLQSSSDTAESLGRAADLRTLQALLRVCLYRARGLSLVRGDTLQELSFSAAESEMERLVRTLAALSSYLDSISASQGLPDTGPPPDAAAEPDMLQAGASARPVRRDQLVQALLAHLEEHSKARKEAEGLLSFIQNSPAGDGDSSSLHSRVVSLEQELMAARNNVKDLHKQLFAEKRECLQLRKEVASLRVGLDTANDRLDNNEIALGRSETYGQVLMVLMAQVEKRLETEQREHEECRARLEQLTAELQEARAKDPLLEAQIKTLGCYLHQRTAEVHTLENRLDLRDKECEEMRVQLEMQRTTARREYEALLAELHHARQDFTQVLCEMRDAMPEPKSCDEEGLTALIQQSNQLSPLVLDDLKTLLHNLKADLAAVDSQTGAFLENHCAVVQGV